MEKIHETFLSEVMEILLENKSVMSFSRPSRLACIQIFWKRVVLRSGNKNFLADMSELLQNFLPEIIVSLRDSNRRSRK